jgi:Stage II sporulation protein E (SpoIIE)
MFPRVARDVVVVVALVAACPLDVAAQMDRVAQPIEFNGGTAELRGPWKFHPGDNSAWASADFDDSSWDPISNDKPWGSQLGFDSYGFAWYRLRIVPGSSAPRELAALFPAVENAYEVYWNGNLVGTYGKLPPRPKWYDSSWSETFGLGRTGDGVLALRVWKAPSKYHTVGVFNFMPLLGSPEAIAQAKAAVDFEWLRSRQFMFGTSSLLGLIFVIGAIGWLRDRKQWVLLWLALFAVVSVAALFLLTLKILLDPVAIGIFQPIVAAGDASLIFLLLWLLDLKEDKRLVRMAIALSVAEFSAGVLGAFALLGIAMENPSPAMIGSMILDGVRVLAELFPLYLIALALKRRRRLDHSRWMVAAACSLVQLVIILYGALTLVGQIVHKDLSGIPWTPLFVIWGNPIQPFFIATPICALTVFYAVYRYTTANRRRQIALEQEFESAREIQSALIPETLPSIPGIALTSVYKPVREVGGDFFQVLPLQSGSTLIVLGDVSGKGLKAAMAVSLIVGMLRALVRDLSGPADLLTALNRSVHGQLQSGFATCIVLRVETDGHCAFVNAGHPAPFLNGKELSCAGALAVGITPDATYEETRFALNPGDYLALYTDGLLEARKGSGELYGFERLHTLLSGKPSAAEAAGAAVAFGQDDDITVLTLARLPKDLMSTAELTGSAPAFP